MSLRPVKGLHMHARRIDAGWHRVGNSDYWQGRSKTPQAAAF